MKIYCSALLVAKVVVAILVAGLLAGFCLGVADLGATGPRPLNGPSAATAPTHPTGTSWTIADGKDIPGRDGVAR
jgi:hypothetical protein